MAAFPRQETSSTDTATYVVAGMSCEHCRVAVTDEVTKVPGVASVEVDLDTKLVRVHGSDVDKAAVVAAIDEGGYDAVSA
jgi:copper chaperone CopZ